jgi:hypothetical protein
MKYKDLNEDQRQIIWDSLVEKFGPSEARAILWVMMNSPSGEKLIDKVIPKTKKKINGTKQEKKIVQITNKKDGVDLFKAGAFGNTLRQWHTPDELRESGYSGKVVIRERSQHGGGFCKYNCEVEDAIKDVLEMGSIFDEHSTPNIERYYFGEQLAGQPENIVLQGEYLHPDYLSYSEVKDFFRPAMVAPKVFKGVGARLIMRQVMDMTSYKNMMRLARDYPDHVIEFSTLCTSAGSLNLNTIIWEVRKY